MTRNKNDIGDLIISINDIDVDINVKNDIYKGIDLYGNSFKKNESNSEESRYNKPYTTDLLDLDSIVIGLNDFESEEVDSPLLDVEMPRGIIKKENIEEEAESIEEESGCINEDIKSNTPVRRKRKKKNGLLLVASTVALGISGTFAYKTYKEYEAEQIRLSELDKENLDLKLIIDTVDEYGDNEYQLNWKEVASVLSVKSNNYPQTIEKSDVLDVCSLFLNKEENKIGDLGHVVNKLEMKPKEKERIFSYYEDLNEYGYTPDKLKSDSEQMEFINSIKDGAFESYKKTGILPSITIAQAILESNWGNSNLVKESNNLFGIKADPSWKGEYVTFETKEYHSMMIKDKFRKYDSKSESIIDHSEFLRSNSRYEEGGVFKARTYKTQALALQESGYSTAEDEDGNKIYASMLEQLIRQYNLQILDWEAMYFAK